MAANPRTRWREHVIRHAGISNATRVLLLVMHDDMDAQGYVSIPRSQLASRLGIPPSRVTERMKQAKAVGLLDTVVAGGPGVRAVYVAALGR